MENQKYKRIKAACCGIFAGAANGLLGAGGGILLVPLFSRWLKLEQKICFATALSVMLPLAVVSAVSYFLFGVRAEFSVLWPYLLGGALGGFLGGKLMKKLPVRLLRIVFALLLVWGGIRSLIV